MLSVAALALVGGCTGGDGAADAGPTPSAPAASTPATSAPATTAPSGEATGTAGQVDCAAVEQARRDLTDTTNAELERLGVDRSDPRAFSVQVLVTSQNAAEYWTAVRDALAEDATELRAAAGTVVGYWQPLDDQLDAIEIPDGSEASLKAATDAYLEISGSNPDDEVVPAQDRLTSGVDSACGAAPAP
jgi:hypothetical protein